MGDNKQKQYEHEQKRIHASQQGLAYGKSTGRGSEIATKGNILYIEGWIIAMQQMCVGDKWEVYIPAEMGYGKFSQPGIPGGSTLIFEIELLGIA